MRKQKIIITIFSVLVMCFISLGYATLTNELIIGGSLGAVPPPFQGVYITNIEIESVSGASSVDFYYIKPTTVYSKVNASQTNGTITYKITVHNNTDYTHWYRGIQYMNEQESNNLINKTNGIRVLTKDKVTDTTTTFDIDHWVPAQQYRSFYVSYTFGSNARGERSTLINFDFGVKIDRVYDEFSDILNDTSPGGGYELISKAFDDNYKENSTMVLGNVGDDKEIFDQLFGPNLTLEVDGVEKPVTIMIRRENIDNRNNGDDYNVSGGPKNCEYTVYVTVDDVSSSGGSATVYAITYTQDVNGYWVQLGEMYEGTCNKQDYDTSNGTYDGAFDVYSWKATPKEYKVADGITYKVGQEQGDQYDKMNTLEDLMSAKDQDIYNDIDNNKIMKKVYDILQTVSNSQEPEVIMLREAFAKANPYFVNYNNGQEFKINRRYIRSEIIPIISELQKALDYYSQVHNSY